MTNIAVDYEQMLPIYQAMDVTTISGISVAEIVGGGDSIEIARHYMPLLFKEGLLNESSNVLDIGSGCGRLSAAIAQYVNGAGSYRGVDIVPGLVEFCNKHISPLYKNASFMALSQPNQSYDWYRREEGLYDIANIDEASAPETIDLCIATSLFTHLDANETRANLAAIYKSLKPDGAAFLTFFLLDPVTRAALTWGRGALAFKHAGAQPGVFIEKPDVPSHAVAFEFHHLADLIAQQGFYIDRILYGAWSGRRICASYQDIIILRKML